MEKCVNQIPRTGVPSFRDLQFVFIQGCGSGKFSDYAVQFPVQYRGVQGQFEEISQHADLSTIFRNSFVPNYFNIVNAGHVKK